MTLNQLLAAIPEADRNWEIVISVEDSELDVCRQADLHAATVCDAFAGPPFIFLHSNVERCRDCKQPLVSGPPRRLKDPQP